MRDTFNTAQLDPYSDIETDAAPTSGQGFAVMLRLLRGRWHWAVLLGVTLAGAGGYLGFSFQDSEFMATSEVTINPDYGVAIDVKDVTMYEPYWNMVQKEIDRFESLDTIETAMQQPAWQEAIALAGPNYTDMSPEDFLLMMEYERPEKKERTLHVHFVSKDPLIAQAGINSLLDAYRIARKQGQNKEIDDNLQLLQEQRRTLEQRERQIKGQMRLVIPDNEYLTIKRRLSAKLGELANMEFNLGELELVIGPFLNPQNQQTQLSIQDLMLKDPEMVGLLEQKEALENEFEYQTEVLGRGPTMASVKQVTRMIARVDRQILDLETSWKSRGTDTEIAMPQQVADMVARHKALSNKVTELQSATNDLATRIAAVEEDELELSQTRSAIRAIQDQIDDFNMTEAVINDNETLTRVVIGPKAVEPMAPSNMDTRIQQAGIGGFGGLGMGFGFVMLIGLMDRRLRHVSDTTADLPDTNMLGVLPTLPADLKDPEQAETAAHCVHHIRTLLQIGGTNRVFSITSPAAGSGKSSLATALGMSFATAGSRTLVIDADIVGAGITRRMGSIVHESLRTVILHKGLVNEADFARAETLAASQQVSIEDVLFRENLLTEEQLDIVKRLQLDTSLGLLDACAPGRLRSCVAATETDNLFVLPVGKARPSDASRLSPAAMRELVRQAREAYDIVLIDTGPVLGSLEASIAAAEADSTVMIVSRGDNRSVASKSLEQLRSVRAQIAGIVFNHALDSDLASGSYASQISQERRPSLSTRKRKLDRTRSARLGPLGTAVASCSEDDSSTEESLMVSSNGNGRPSDH
ncbi:MAG: hypothetical protein AB8C95_01185 [Phycisphaeraceae bacterium]